MDEITERDLIEQSRNGKWRAFDALMRCNQEKVYRLAYRLTGRHEEADTVTQDVFVQAYRSLNNFEGRSRLATWLHTIAVRTVQNLRRRRNSSPSVASLSARPEIAEDARRPAASDPAKAAANKEFQELLDDAIMKLPFEQRAALTLVALDGLSYADAARCLECSEGTVSWRIWRARHCLRKMLSGYLND